MLAALIGVLAVTAVGAFIAMAYRRGWRWTGLSADPGDGTPAAAPRPAKTLWDWLQLLIIPVVLALAAFALNATQADRDRKQEDRRAARDRAIAADRAREDTLRVYLEQMSDLITKQRLRSGAVRSQAGVSSAGDVTTLARTLTLIALRRLNGERKGLVVQFLIEEGLISTKREWIKTRNSGWALVTEGKPRISLSGADLRGVVLRGVHLLREWGRPTARDEYTIAANLDHTDLRHSDFRGADLNSASLRQADLRDADFSDASINRTLFSASCLSGARFARAKVVGSEFQYFHSTQPADFRGTEGREVDFSHAQLNHANFERAQLTDVNLRGATTTGVVWPEGWTSTGLRMEDAHARDLCRGSSP